MKTVHRLARSVGRLIGTVAKTRMVATRCGHPTALEGKVFGLGGEASSHMKMPPNDVGSTDYCLECIGKMTIRCAWCAGPIFIGSPVTLYTPDGVPKFKRCKELGIELVDAPGLSFQIPEDAIVHNLDPIQLVGCPNMDCADSDVDIQGKWVPGPDGKGMVLREQSLLEMSMEDMAKGGNGIIIARYY